MFIVPVILSGGQGVRLWPLTSAEQSKPLLKLPSGKTLLEETFSRAKRVSKDGPIVTVTRKNDLMGTLSAFDAGSGSNPHHVILEPKPRDTAAAIAIALSSISKWKSSWSMPDHENDPVILILPADHVIDSDPDFQLACQQAIAASENYSAVIMGVKPTSPATSFGYIQTTGSDVTAFHEKPDQNTAQSFLENGSYLWNCGIVCGRLSKLVGLFHQFGAKLIRQAEKLVDGSVVSAEGGNHFTWLNPRQHARCQSISFDHLVLEKAKGLGCVHGSFNWNDVGTFDAFSQLFSKDASGNVPLQSGFVEESNNCFLYSTNRRIAAYGLDDIMVVDSADTILVTTRRKSSEIKKLLEKFNPSVGKQDQKLVDVKRMNCAKRPWGKFDVLDEGAGFKVKRLEVDPGGKLSLQSHRFRSEHWLVVQGSATIVSDDKIHHLSAGQSIDIGKHVRHRICNETQKKLIIIETQQGDYLEEDDEVRYDDLYGRSSPSL